MFANITQYSSQQICQHLNVALEDRVHAAANRLPDALHRRLRTGDVVHARRRGREVDRKRTFVDHFRWRKNWTRPTTRRFMRLTPNRGLTTACTKNL